MIKLKFNETEESKGWLFQQVSIDWEENIKEGEKCLIEQKEEKWIKK